MEAVIPFLADVYFVVSIFAAAVLRAFVGVDLRVGVDLLAEDWAQSGGIDPLNVE